MTAAWIGLGSNLGDRRANLQAALDALGPAGIDVVRASSVYETDPVGPIGDQPPFLNAAAQADTDLDPEALLDALKAIEVALGRDPEGVPQGPRVIDLDVLLLDEAHASARLTVPHPGLLQRRFALIPILELKLAARTPDGVLLADALAALPVDEDVRFAGPPLSVRPRPPRRSDG